MILVIIQIAAAVFVVACLASTLIICAEKWRIIEFYEIRIKGTRILGHKIGELCIFCLGFWISFVLVLIVYLLFDVHQLNFVVPFASASLSRVIYESAKPK